jgi:hypothetical protein
MTIKRKTKRLGKRLQKAYTEASFTEFWIDGVLTNFTFGFIAASLVSFVALQNDILVLLGYLIHFFFLGKVVNRPKYVTELGKFIVFPIPTAIGAFTGYKLSFILNTIV